MTRTQPSASPTPSRAWRAIAALTLSLVLAPVAMADEPTANAAAPAAATAPAAPAVAPAAAPAADAVAPPVAADPAVEGILWSAFGTRGQRCSACSRLIVQKGVRRELEERLVARATALGLQELMVRALGDVVPGPEPSLELGERGVDLPGHRALLGLRVNDLGRHLLEITKDRRGELHELDLALVLRP
mgnify:CR=1 FL=1